MKLKKYIFLILIPLAISCNKKPENNTEAKPGNIIPKEKMVELMVDIHLVEGTTRYAYGKTTESEEYQDYLYSYVLEKHNISFEDFTNSIRYYTKDINTLADIYSEVLSELSEMQSKAKNE
ncbi:MAG: DUF4296 domain-containing protein [Saprospiraceae bacterium]|nr:DUF4296 domain-containing protein [Saprospiraceae bacterium]